MGEPPRALPLAPLPPTCILMDTAVSGTRAPASCSLTISSGGRSPDSGAMSAHGLLSWLSHSEEDTAEGSAPACVDRAHQGAALTDIRVQILGRGYQ